MTRRLRVIEPADLPALARLHALCFPEDRWDEKALEDLLSMAGASGHLVEDVQEPRPPRGFILDLVIAAEGEILTLAVSPDCRRQGIGRALLADLFERAWRRGAHAIGLEVAADNAGARRLYESCGFSPTGRRRGYYRRRGVGIDALLFRRPLLP